MTCPYCHDQDEAVELNLRDLSECRCPACDETFSPRQAYDKARELVEEWRRVAEWMELAATIA